MSSVILELEDFAVRYRSGFGVGPVSGALGPGVYHLRGENGAGKSSLLRAMCAEIRPHRGSCRVYGEDVWVDVRARRHIAYLAPSPELPVWLHVDEAWRLFASLRGAPEWDGAPWREALGIDPGLRLAHASSGQRRRAELLAATAGDPSVLLLDEVFTHLDTGAVELLCAWIEGWRAERVVIWTGHAEVPVRSDRTFSLERGGALEL